MGQESEAAERKEIFRHYQVNTGLMTLAGEEAVFMHCLPAHRGEEVTDMVAGLPGLRDLPASRKPPPRQKAVMVPLMGRPFWSTGETVRRTRFSVPTPGETFLDFEHSL
jgi:ornithine carbamoyltransferase